MMRKALIFEIYLCNFTLLHQICQFSLAKVSSFTVHTDRPIINNRDYVTGIRNGAARP